MTEGYVLAIDQGTTGTIALVFDRADQGARLRGVCTDLSAAGGWADKDR